MLKRILFVFMFLANFCFSMGIDDYYKKHLIVIENNVEAKEFPDIESKTITTLSINRLIIPETNQDNKDWLFINTGNQIFSSNDQKFYTISGWILKNKVTSLSNFKKIKIFYKCNLIGYDGDVDYNFKINKNGTYSRIIVINGKKKFISGELYRFKNSIVAKDTTGLLVFFYINEEGYLVCPFLGTDDEILKIYIGKSYYKE